MKIIDQTPFYKENSSLSLMDRGKAMLQFGTGWMKEVEAQNTVISVLGRALDKKFTLLHNVTPPGLGTTIPIILVGPSGVYVMGINHHAGMFSARGDQWKAISGGTLKTEKPNLMIRTERMARAVQVFLQRQGSINLNGVEAVLLCSDPAGNVDSVRPIVRVVMRDALERFAVSIADGRLVLKPETVFDIVERLLNPPKAPPPQVEMTTAEIATRSGSILTDAALPASEITSSQTNEALPPSPPSPPSFDWMAQPAEPPVAGPPIEPFTASPQDVALVRRRGGITGKQWVFLIMMAVVWFIITAVLAYLIARDFLPR